MPVEVRVAERERERVTVSESGREIESLSGGLGGGGRTGER